MELSPPCCDNGSGGWSLFHLPQDWRCGSGEKPGLVEEAKHLTSGRDSGGGGEREVDVRGEICLPDGIKGIFVGLMIAIATEGARRAVRRVIIPGRISVVRKK